MVADPVRVAGYDSLVPPPNPRKVLLIGAGGHARVCVEALLDMGAKAQPKMSARSTAARGAGAEPPPSRPAAAPGERPAHTRRPRASSE